MIRAFWGLSVRDKFRVPSAGKDEEQLLEGIRLDLFPTEIIMEIMEQADLATFICLSQASSRYREIAQRSTFRVQHREGAASLTKFLAMRPGNRHEADFKYSEIPVLLRWPEERSTLRESLRKTLFCEACLQHRRTEYDFFDRNFLFKRRKCRACSLAAGGYVNHPLWQFRRDDAWKPGQCLVKTGHVQFCRHISWTREILRENRKRNWSYSRQQKIVCDSCTANITSWDLASGSFIITWRIDSSGMPPNYSSSSELERDHKPILDLMTQKGVASGIYICPHHDLSDGRLESIVAGLWGKDHRHVLGPTSSIDALGRLAKLRVSARLGCRYCSATIQMMVMYEAQIERPGMPLVALKYHKILEIEFRVERVLDPTETSTWITNLELGNLGPLPRHQSLEHLTWCEDAQCATNKKANLCPVLLLEHDIWGMDFAPSSYGWKQKRRTQRYYAAGFPLLDTLDEDENSEGLLDRIPCCTTS